MLEFDEFDQWIPSLSQRLNCFVSDRVRSEIKLRNPKYIEDALDILFELADRFSIIHEAKRWLEESNILAFHGSRLTEYEVNAIKEGGLCPLAPEKRIKSLAEFVCLSPIKNQAPPDVQGEMSLLLGKRLRNGREGQVHLTLSRLGLLTKFNHYLTHGSEFDQRVIQCLLGDSGLELLQTRGAPMLFTFKLPGSDALVAANRFNQSLSCCDKVPNIVREFLSAWSFRLVSDKFSIAQYPVDCGLIFYKKLSPAWIVDIKEYEARKVLEFERVSIILQEKKTIDLGK